MEKYNLNGKSMHINMTNCPQKRFEKYREKKYIFCLFFVHGSGSVSKWNGFAICYVFGNNILLVYKVYTYLGIVRKI